MKESSTHGVWDIENTVSEDLGEERITRPDGTSYGVTRTMMHLGGQPHLRARNQAVAALFPVPVEVTAAKSTVLVLHDSGSVSAIEGRPIQNDGRPFLLRKGTQRSGYYLDRMNVLAAFAGYRPEVAELTWVGRRSFVPELVKFSLDGIPERVEDEDGISDTGSQITAVFLATHPGFGRQGEGRTAGCLWLVTDKQSPAEGETETILNGYFWCPEGAELTAEHGSIHASQLERWAGRVKDFTPGAISFRECVMEELPTDRVAAYRRVLAPAHEGASA